MRLAKVPTGNGDAISLTFQHFKGRTLIECHEPAALLKHLSGGSCSPSTTSNSYVRGVILPEEDAIFELFDQFGIAVRNALTIPREQAKARLLDAMICQVQG